MNVLVTGGAGYIGTHTIVELMRAGHRVVVLDNLANSSLEAIRRVGEITGHVPKFLQGDIRDRALLDRILSDYPVDAVMHFAGLKAVGESARLPLTYYDNNVHGTLALCQAMAAAGVYRLVFSSSATVYGEPRTLPITEDQPAGAVTNPYGRSKFMVEQVLQDLAASAPRWSIASLRYFNPVGAHPSGLIGEDPKGLPNNLVPFISQVGIGKLPELSIYGADFPTCDGTGVRDYIHVVDLAKGHLAALDAISQRTGIDVWNLGTGRGYSVLEVVAAFEKAANRSISYRVTDRRPGDIAECWSDPGKAARELGWKAELSLREMMEDTWRWQRNNPQG